MGERLRAIGLVRPIVLMLFLITIPPVGGEPLPAKQPPGESVAKLQSVFRGVADGLWVECEKAWHAGRHDVCIGLCRMITDIDPSFTEAYSLGAWLLWSAGQDAEAIAVYRRAVAANPKGWEPAFDFGMYYYGKKNYVEAESNFALATRNSAPSTVWKMLAHAREKLGRLPGALAAWDRVRELDPTDPVIEPNVKRVREAMGKGVE